MRRVGHLQFRSRLVARLVASYRNEVSSGDDEVARGPGKGLRINASGTNAGYVLGTEEPKIQAALAAVCRPGWTCYDLGAHIGFFSLLMARTVGADGLVVAFEPLSENVQRLRHNLALNAPLPIAVVPAAVGSAEGEALFAVAKRPTQGHLVAAESEKRPDEPAVVSVPLTSIDAVVASSRFPPPELVKIDVEGGEVAVFDGMTAVLDRYRPLVFCELHGNQTEVAARLERHGYVYVHSAGEEPLEDAPWWAFVVAAPRESPAALAVVRDIFGLRPSRG